MAKKHLLKNGCFFVIKIFCKKAKKAAEKRKSPANAGRRHKNGKLSTKEVKNGHIAKGKNPVKDKKCDSGFFKCGKKKFFQGYASSVKIKSERKIISSSPTKGFINSTVRIRSPGRTSGTPE